MAATDMVFAKPPTPQQASPLLRLPAELRVKILELRLGSAAIIKPLTCSMRESVGSAQRSAQLLRTCQQLYYEGQVVLYDNSVVAIEFEQRFEAYTCRILNSALHLSNCFPIAPCTEEPSLLNGARAICRGEGPDGMWRRVEAERFIQLYPTLMKIRCFRVCIQWDSQESVFVQFRVLRALLENKHVTCVRRGLVVDWLESCKILRCSSFNFKRPGDPRLYEDLPITSDTIARNTFLQDLQETITSRTIVRDTFLQWSDFMTNFVPKNRVDDARGLYELKQHMLKCDFDAFEAQEKYLMKETIEFNRLWAELS